MSDEEMFRANDNVAVRHPQHGGYVTPSQTDALPASDPLVREYPWLFVRVGEVVPSEPALRESAPIEQATRAPGERRGTRRPRGTRGDDK